MRDMRMLELGAQPDLPEEPVGGDADQQLRMQDLQRDPLALGVAGEIDPGVAALPDLPLDLVLALERPAHQRQHVSRNGQLPVEYPLWSRAGPSGARRDR